jgi:hypothetical protein
MLIVFDSELVENLHIGISIEYQRLLCYDSCTFLLSIGSARRFFFFFLFFCQLKRDTLCLESNFTCHMVDLHGISYLILDFTILNHKDS